jgi:hypothetical protein
MFPIGATLSSQSIIAKTRRTDAPMDAIDAEQRYSVDDRSGCGGSMSAIAVNGIGSAVAQSPVDRRPSNSRALVQRPRPFQ